MAREPRQPELNASSTMIPHPISPMIPDGRPEFTSRLFRIGVLASLVLGSLIPLSCDNTFVDPFDNDGDIYSVYGFISLYRTQHFVRVVPVTRYPQRITSPDDPQATIDARVHTVDLTTGRSTQWGHSLVRMTDGTYGHVFSASFEPRPGRSYRLVVTRSDGKTATAETRIPYAETESRLEFDPSPAIDDYYNREGVVRPIDAVLNNAFLPVNVVVEYSVHSIRTAPFRVRKVRSIDIDYGVRGAPNHKGQIEFLIHFARDASLLSGEISRLQFEDELGRAEVRIQHMTIKMTVLDDQWVPEGGAFDPVELSLPGTLSNVENGFGFFGAVGYLEQTFELGAAYNPVFGLDEQ